MFHLQRPIATQVALGPGDTGYKFHEIPGPQAGPPAPARSAPSAT